MSAVFADTFYWIALINPGDRYAQEVQRFDDLLSAGNVYTTEEVLVEVLTVLRRRYLAQNPRRRNRARDSVRPRCAFLSGRDRDHCRPGGTARTDGNCGRR